MRIGNIGSTSGSSSSKKTKEKDKPDGSFGSLLDASAKTSGTDNTPVSGVLPIAGIFAAQQVDEVSDDTPRRKALQKGNEVLEELDSLRLEMLSGQISARTAQRLAEKATEQLDVVMDPRLKSILEEIELRAQVELAKLSR